MTQENNKDQTTDEVIIDDIDTEPDADCPKCAEYLAGWKRAKADYTNLEKQSAKDRAEYIAYANQGLLEEILPAIDQYETALSFIPDISNVPEPEQKQLQNWITGIKAVKQLWEQMFQEIGLQKIPTTDQFDPMLHNAVGKEVDKEKPEGAIIKEIQPGWTLKDKVIRPAKVIVNDK